MSAEIARPAWLRLYKQLIKEGRNFACYNYREYAVRRIRDHFRLSRASDLSADQLENLYKKGQQELISLGRQTAVSHLYAGPRSIIEKNNKII